MPDSKHDREENFAGKVAFRPAVVHGRARDEDVDLVGAVVRELGSKLLSLLHEVRGSAVTSRGPRLWRGDADLRALGGSGLSGGRLLACFECVLEPAGQTLHLPVAAVEPVDDLQQDLVLVH